MFSAMTKITDALLEYDYAISTRSATASSYDGLKLEGTVIGNSKTCIDAAIAELPNAMITTSARLGEYDVYTFDGERYMASVNLSISENNRHRKDALPFLFGITVDGYERSDDSAGGYPGLVMDMNARSYILNTFALNYLAERTAGYIAKWKNDGSSVKEVYHSAEIHANSRVYTVELNTPTVTICNTYWVTIKLLD